MPECIAQLRMTSLMMALIRGPAYTRCNSCFSIRPCRLAIRPTIAASIHLGTSCLGYRISQNVRDCYQLLNISEESGLIEAKEAYLKLAKMYHPDSQSRQADANKFTQVQQAFDTVCLHIEKLEKQGRREGLEDEMEQSAEGSTEFDIRHTAPQHRQYLEYEGHGFGTPSQRQKQYQKYRAAKAADAVSTHRIYKIAITDETGLVVKDKKAARKVRTTNVIERLVEDLIQDSMAKGEFDDLPGMGKPLPPKTAYCPYIDLSTHNLNQVLVNNGYAPEWIQLDKEIRSSLQDAKKSLLRERLKLGGEPLNDFNVKKWAGLQIEFAETVKSINRRVNDFNLIVPILRLQMVHIQADKEIAKVVAEYNKMEKERDVLQTQKEAAEEKQVVEDHLAIMMSKIYQSLDSFLTYVSSSFRERGEQRNEDQMKIK